MKFSVYYKIYLLTALAACILAGCKKKEAIDSQPSTQVLTQVKQDWPIFRGNPELAGFSQDAIPDKLRLLAKYNTRKPILSSPIIVQDKVYIGSKDGNLYCLGLSKLDLKWMFTSDGPIEAPPLYFSGSIFFGSVKGTVYSLNADNGNLKWKNFIGDKILGSGNILNIPELKASLLIGSYDNKLYSLDTSSGRKNWAFKTDNYVNGAPAISGKKIIFGGCDARLYILDGLSGRKLHAVNIGSYIAGSAAVDGDFAYIGHYKGEFLKINLLSQQIAWKYGNEDNNAPFFSSPALSPELALIGSRDKKLHAVYKDTGKKAWTFSTKGIVDSSPVIAGDKVIACSEDGRIYILNLANGLQSWSYDLGTVITASPAVSQGKIIIGADDGYVYLFGEGK